MKSVPLITIAAATLCALAASGTAAGASPAAPASAPPPLHVLNLHSAFMRALKSVKTGPIAHASQRGTRTAARAAASCTEPNCDLSYGGGAVQLHPRVYILLWGPNWPDGSPVFSYLANLYESLGLSGDSWSTITSQYGDSSGNPTFGRRLFEGGYQDSSTPPDPVTPGDLAAEATGLATRLGITDLADAQIVVVSQSGTCFSDGFVGSCGTVNSSGTYCAWHTYATGGGLAGDLPFTNLPYQPDAGSDCGENFVNSGSAGTYDGFSILAGHEYAETITDPEPFGGWSDSADTISDNPAPGEIGDKCAWGGSNWGKLGSDPYGDVTLSMGTFAMQSLWSNAAGGCVMTIAPVLKVTTPGTQKSILGARVSLQVHATTNTGTPLTYTAKELPDGLSIASHTGKISGTPGVTAGTYAPQVTVSGTAGTQTVSFRWQVSSKAGAVKGYARKCADDYRSKIDLWTCNGQARQRITFTASGELQVAGRCITSGSGAAVLRRCAGSSAQTWTRRSNGQYLVKSGGCLTDPRNSRRNGTQLRLEACTRAADQRWSLP